MAEANITKICHISFDKSLQKDNFDEIKLTYKLAHLILVADEKKAVQEQAE